MPTRQSTALVKAFLDTGPPRARTTHVQTHKFSSPAQALFSQLCPARELDWIDGWQCELVHTSTGYMEADCVFTTPESNVFGPGIWICTRYEPPVLVELVRVQADVLIEHIRIELIDHGDGTCTGTWRLLFSSLSEQGDAIVRRLAKESEDLGHALSSLDAFVAH